MTGKDDYRDPRAQAPSDGHPADKWMIENYRDPGQMLQHRLNEAEDRYRSLPRIHASSSDGNPAEPILVQDSGWGGVYIKQDGDGCRDIITVSISQLKPLVAELNRLIAQLDKPTDTNR